MTKLKTRKRPAYATDGEEVEVTGVLADRLLPDGRRRLKLTQRERRDLHFDQKVNQAVELYLDLETRRTTAQIASAMGISVMALKDLTKTQAFMDAYTAHFIELAGNPHIKAAQAAIADMVPLAVTELRRMIENPETSPTVKLSAIREVLKMAGLGEVEKATSDRNEVAEFLKNAGVKIENLNVNVPPGNPSGAEGGGAAVVEGDFEPVE